MKWMRFIIVLVGLSIIQLSFAQSRKQRKAEARANATTEANVRTHIGVLANDSLEGRRTGTPGEEKAVHYIETYYKQIEVPGAGANGEYRQPFVVDEGKVIGKASYCKLNNHALELGKEVFPLAWGGEKQVKAPTSVALNEAGGPWWYDLKDDLAANENNPHFIPEELLRSKAQAAAEKGATALLVFNSGSADDGLKFNGKDRAASVSIPVWYFTKEGTAKYKIGDSESFEVDASLSFEAKKRNGINVAAFINNNAAQTIVLGAHLDHLGYGEDANSRYTGAPAIHNGADDNASGTAAVLELARILKASGTKAYNYLFLNFSGEELGLYGSKYYTEHPLLDFSKVNYMVNMDMVGRLNDSSKVLTVGGFGTSPSWPSLLKTDQQKAFTVKIDSSGTGPSDHTSFYRKDIPVLFFFTGLHTDYHKPSDDADRINYTGEVAIINYISTIVNTTPPDTKLAFTKTREQQMGTGRFKVSIGIMPDYTYTGQGVKADGVIDGRPAQKAGLKVGDVIVQLGEHLITGMETYMAALNRFEKGQSTTVTVKRDKEVLEFPITF